MAGPGKIRSGVAARRTDEIVTSVWVVLAVCARGANQRLCRAIFSSGFLRALCPPAKATSDDEHDQVEEQAHVRLLQILNTPVEKDVRPAGKLRRDLCAIRDTENEKGRDFSRPFLLAWRHQTTRFF